MKERLPRFLITFSLWEKITLWNSLVGQWLGLGYSIAGSTSSIPGWATNIQQAVQAKGKKKITFKKKNNQFCQLGHFCSFFSFLMD